MYSRYFCYQKYFFKGVCMRNICVWSNSTKDIDAKNTYIRDACTKDTYSGGNTYVKGDDINVACIAGICVRRVCIRSTCIGNTCAKGTSIDSIIIENILIKDVYSKNTCIKKLVLRVYLLVLRIFVPEVLVVKHSEIYSHFF